jgi:hypothetical protein
LPVGATLGAGALVGGGSIVSGILGSNAASKASAQQVAQEQAALQFQQQVLAQNQSNLNPFIQTGQGASYSLANLFGLPGANGQVTSPNYSSFYNSPNYQFAFQQGQNATQNVLAAQGNLLSGSGLTALTNFGQGLASQQYGNYVNQLLGISGQGIQAGGALAGASTNAANSIANTFGSIGQSQAAGTIGSTNAITGAISGGVNNLILANALGNRSGYGNTGNWLSNIFNSGGSSSNNVWSSGTSAVPFPGIS